MESDYDMLIKPICVEVFFSNLTRNVVLNSIGLDNAYAEELKADLTVLVVDIWHPMLKMI
jgi:hypothetical protein